MTGGIGIVVREDIGIHILHGQLSQKHQNGGHDDGQQRPVGHSVFEHLPNRDLFVLFAGIIRNPLCDQLIGEQIADDGQNRKEQCGPGNLAAVDHIYGFSGGEGHFIKGNQGQSDADKHTGQHTADGAVGRQAGAVTRIGRNGRGHRAIGDVDAGIAERAPKNIGEGQIGDPGSSGPGGYQIARKAGRIHQKGRNGHRQAHPQQPGFKFSCPGGFGGITDAAHGHIRDRVHKPGQHHDRAHNTGGDTHDVGVEFHQDASG